MRSKHRWIVATAMTLAFVRAAAADQPCGDVTGNGKVTTADAQAVLKESVGQPVNLQCAPSAQPLKTGETTNRGPYSDGTLEAGVARSFTDNGDGTVTDDATGLMWEKKDNAGGIHDKENKYSWTAGNGDMNGTIVTTFLAGLNAGTGFAGYKDWRIPNRFELESLLNVGASIPAAYPAFDTDCPGNCTVLTCSCTRSGYYWSSTSFHVDPTGAWSIRFDDADATAILKTETVNARAVRGGN